MAASKGEKPSNKKRVSVFDVAKAANVSVATVSRAFNLPNLVREDVRRRVIENARRLDYTANPAARALRSRKTHIIGTAIPTLDHAIFAKMINSFQDTFAQHGYMTIVSTTGFDNTKIFEKVKILVDRGAEALLLVGEIRDAALKRFLKETSIPAITTYSYLPNEIIPSVGFDNYSASFSVLGYLADLGHTHFALIAASTSGNDRQRSRIAGYKDFIEARGLVGADRVIIRPHEVRSGADAIRTLLKDYPDTTAVVSTSDVAAFGAVSECKRLGIQVPQDLSITGFDDSDYDRYLDPPLTTIAVPAKEMGSIGANVLFEALTTGGSPRSVKLDSQLVVRNSACPPRVKQLSGSLLVS
ncbi:LacI family transcriptional regulator OS=Castellaniella defragrans OX=75697 GN=HNR28_000959 PE=4 SV=1 [Castellaniella defragrans]